MAPEFAGFWVGVSSVILLLMLLLLFWACSFMKKVLRELLDELKKM